MPNTILRDTLGLDGLEFLEALVQLDGCFAFVLALDGPALGQSLLGLLLADEGAQLLQDNILLQFTVLQSADLLEEAVGEALDVLSGVLEVLGLDLGHLLLSQLQLGGALLTMLLGQSLLVLVKLNGLRIIFNSIW